jgi:hypothetical protein
MQHVARCVADFRPWRQTWCVPPKQLFTCGLRGPEGGNILKYLKFSTGNCCFNCKKIKYFTSVCLYGKYDGIIKYKLDDKPRYALLALLFLLEVGHGSGVKCNELLSFTRRRFTHWTSSFVQISSGIPTDIHSHLNRTWSVCFSVRQNTWMHAMFIDIAVEVI